LLPIVERNLLLGVIVFLTTVKVREMRQVKKAGYQEALVDRMVEDLKKG
jgi:hypothetical protein